MSNALEWPNFSTKPYHKIHMFNIVQQLVPNCCSVVVVVAHMVLEQHKELEQHKVLEQEAGT